MATIIFAKSLGRHVACPSSVIYGATVRCLLDQVFAGNPVLRGYVLDDGNALRKHMNIFVDGQMVTDRQQLSDPVGPNAQVYVLQALSGG